jgi:hypothetical protein
MAARLSNPAAIGKGAKKGSPTRVAGFTPEKRSENARKTVSARQPKSGNGTSSDARESTPADSLSTSKQALHLCMKPLKNAQDESEIRRLTNELQRIVFHKQYRNAEIRKPPPGPIMDYLALRFRERPDIDRRFRRIARSAGIRSGCATWKNGTSVSADSLSRARAISRKRSWNRG